MWDTGDHYSRHSAFHLCLPTDGLARHSVISRHCPSSLCLNRLCWWSSELLPLLIFPKTSTLTTLWCLLSHGALWYFSNKSRKGKRKEKKSGVLRISTHLQGVTWWGQAANIRFSLSLRSPGSGEHMDAAVQFRSRVNGWGGKGTGAPRIWIKSPESTQNPWHFMQMFAFFSLQGSTSASALRNTRAVPQKWKTS